MAAACGLTTVRVAAVGIGRLGFWRWLMGTVPGKRMGRQGTWPTAVERGEGDEQSPRRDHRRGRRGGVTKERATASRAKLIYGLDSTREQPATGRADQRQG